MKSSQNFLNACKSHADKGRSEKDPEISKKMRAQNFNLKEQTDKNLARVVKEYDGDKNRKMPQGLEEFCRSEMYQRLLQNIMEYCLELFKLEEKQHELKADAEQRGLPVPQILNSEIRSLNAKAKKMADSYAQMIYLNKSIGQNNDEIMAKCFSSDQFKTKINQNQRNDQAFYEAIMHLSQMILQHAFEQNEITKLAGEISRLFRSNAFNISERKIQENRRMEKFPALQEIKTKEGQDPRNSINQQTILTRMEQRMRIPKEPFKSSIMSSSPKNEIRPLFVNLTPYSATNGRSPLLSLVFPTVKDKINNMRVEEVKRQKQKSQSPIFLKNEDLEKIVQVESRNRQMHSSIHSPIY